MIPPAVKKGLLIREIKAPATLQPKILFLEKKILIQKMSLAGFAITAFLGVAVGVFIVSPIFGETVQPGNSTDSRSVKDELLSAGLELPAGQRRQLPEPIRLSTASPDAVRKELEPLWARHGWERFSRNSVMAPVHVELQPIHNSDGNRVGHNLYSAFLAYFDMTAIDDRDLMESLFQSDREGEHSSAVRPNDIPQQLLDQFGLTAESMRFEEQFRVIDLPLMNRVTIRGVVRIEEKRSEDSLFLAWKLDPRFTPSSFDELDESLWPFTNHSIKADRDELGRTRESAPVPYMGLGGYMSIQRTGIEEGQQLIESRMLLFEPQDWFAGSNFLRSKFPAMLQESAQTFRRKLGR